MTEKIEIDLNEISKNLINNENIYITDISYTSNNTSNMHIPNTTTTGTTGPITTNFSTADTIYYWNNNQAYTNFPPPSKFILENKTKDKNINVFVSEQTEYKQIFIKNKTFKTKKAYNEITIQNIIYKKYKITENEIFLNLQNNECYIIFGLNFNKESFEILIKLLFGYSPKKIEFLFPEKIKTDYLKEINKIKSKLSEILGDNINEHTSSC